MAAVLLLLPAIVCAAETPQALSTLEGAWTMNPAQPFAARSATVGSAADSWNLSNSESLAITASCTGQQTALVYLRWRITSKFGGLYEVEAPVKLNAQTPVTVVLPLAGSAGALIPIGHQRPWDALASAQVKSVELQADWRGPYEHGPLTLNLSQLTLAPRSAGQPKAIVTDVKLERAPATLRAKGVLSFRIDPPPADPFAVSGDGDVRVVQADGKERLAFFDQALARINDGPTARSIAVGRPLWRAYVDAGDGPWSFQIKSGVRTWTIRDVRLPDNPVPLRVDGERSGAGSNIAAHLRWEPPLEIDLPAAKNFSGGIWRLDNGSWSATAEKGISPRAWRPVPFWNANWSQFDGAACVNFEEAARMDALLNAAAEQGRGLPMALLPGEILDSSGEFNWQSHPLNNSAFPTRASTLTEAAGMDFYARWMRYVLARWESAQAVCELRITTALNSPDTPGFMKRVGEWLKPLPRRNETAVVSQDPLTTPLEELGSVESFASAEGNPLACWHPDFRFGPSTLSIQPKKEEHTGNAGVLARDPFARTLGIAGDYQYGPPALLCAGDGVMFDIFLPPEQPPDLRAGMHLCTDGADAEWFDVVFPELLRPGEWNRFVLDLTSANTSGMRGLKSGRAWSAEQRSRVFQIGIHLFSTHAGWNFKGRTQPLAMQLTPLRAVRFGRSQAARPASLAGAGTMARWNPQTVLDFPISASSNIDLPSAWRANTGLARSTESVVDRLGPNNASCFQVRASEPGATAIGATERFLFGTPGDLAVADTLLFDLWVPPDSPGDLRAGVHLIDQNGDWLHTVLLSSPTPGGWTTYAVDLSAANRHNLTRVNRDAAGTSASDPIRPITPIGPIVALHRLFEFGVELYSTHPNWSSKESGFLPLSLRLANVRAARLAPPASGRPEAGGTNPFCGEPKRVASLSDSAQCAFSWLVDSHLGSPAKGTESHVEGMHEFSIQSNYANATSLCVIGKSSDRSLMQWKQPAHDDFFAADALMFQVWIPADTQSGAKVGVHLRNRNDQWFEALLPNPLIPEQWNTCAIDLTANNVHHLKPLGNEAVWNDYSRQRIREIGIHVYATAKKDQALTCRIRDVRSVMFVPPAKEQVPEIALFDATSQKPAAPLSAPARLKKGELWECNFTISKTFANPFDPCECDVYAEIRTPSDKLITVPAFFNQRCRRREEAPNQKVPSALGKTSGGDEIVEAYGNEFFTVRYRPLETGAYGVTLKLCEGGSYRELNEGKNRLKFVPGKRTAAHEIPNPFVVTDPPPNQPYRGFIRLAADKQHLQFDDGTFFYPIGPCLRSPSDTRIPYADPKWNMTEIARIGRRGTYQYDEYFKDAAENGCNWARVWMCSWWGALEWRRDWPGYQGLGRYNLLNAWRIDYLLGEAERLGLKVNLCLTNHGQFSPEVDTEWANNPYGSGYGGPLHAPREFFTAPEARILHQNKLRYVVARYGHSPAIMAWALFSEVEFTQEYAEGRHQNVTAWHAEMSTYLKEIDPNRHLVITHFSHPKNGASTLVIPEIDIAASNAYSVFGELSHTADAAEALAAFWAGNGRFAGFSRFKKPAMVEEQGRHFMGGSENTRRALEADLHCGLWGSMVQPLVGATGYWWWLQLHYDHQWRAYKPLAAFMKGEDFRAGRNEKTLEPLELELSNTQLRGRALASQERAYVWVYHANLPTGGQVEAVADAEVTLPPLRAGEYDVEFWSTQTGTVVSHASVHVNGAAKLKLPSIDGDVAIKIKTK